MSVRGYEKLHSSIASSQFFSFLNVYLNFNLLFALVLQKHFL